MFGIFLLGFGFGGFLGLLAVATAYWLGWRHYTPWSVQELAIRLVVGKVTVTVEDR